MKTKRIHFDCIDSTNTWAKLHADELDPEALWLITADEQSAGRGRFDRSWVSPPRQNVYATFCFFREKLWEGVGHVPQVLALSAIEVLENLGFHPRIKWPNDVLLSEKKVAGILAETSPCRHGIAVVVGIGINVNMPEDVCASIDRPATSLLVEGAGEVLISEVIDPLEALFSRDLERFFQAGFAPSLPRFRTLATPPDPHIAFSDGQRVWEGQQTAIDDAGALRLQLPTGEFKTFHAGEILFN